MKKEAIILPVLFYLCMFLPFKAFSQESTPSAALDFFKGNGSILGQLTDSITAEPLEFATIALFEKDLSQPIDGTVTDESGLFFFSNLSPGEYEIVVSFIGYATKTIQKISVTEEKPEIMLGSIELSPDVTQLQEVTVQTLRPTIVQKEDRIVVSFP